MEFRGQKLEFIESSNVKDGVVCGVYEFKDDDSKDLGIVKVSAGYKTPLQKVLKGDKTLEIFKSGSGVLTVSNTDGEKRQYIYPDDENIEIQVSVGETMQWEAKEDLEFYEVCYPPYEEGRFEDLAEQ